MTGLLSDSTLCLGRRHSTFAARDGEQSLLRLYQGILVMLCPSTRGDALGLLGAPHHTKPRPCSGRGFFAESQGQG